MKIVTREMVAERAKVSKQTVSCYLNGTRQISEKTCKRIEEAIKELGYIPNQIAQSLSKKSTKTLAVICNDISNPNYSEIISGIEHEAQKINHTVLIYDAKTYSENTTKDIISRKVDGVISLTFKEKIGNKALDYFLLNDIATVITHAAGKKDERFMQLEPDFEIGIRESINKLKELGHKEVAMLSAFPLSLSFDTRFKTFIECYKDIYGKDSVNVSPDEAMLTTLETGEKLATKFIESGNSATAVLATNDLVAIGALKTFAKAGKKIKVIGIDNTVFCDYVDPALSSIGYDKEAYGEELVRMFMEKVLGGNPRFAYFPTYLNERKSLF